MAVRVIGPHEFRPPDVIDTTSRSKNWSRGLSPFFLGPVPLYEGAVTPVALNVENGYQFCKVYPEHVGEDGLPTPDYFEWAKKGWEDEWAHRRPMGRRPPSFSWWAGEKLGYVEARKRIYIPVYAKAVYQTVAFQTLLAHYRKAGEVTLWDFDGYDYAAQGKTLKEVVNDPLRPMGHAFVLAHLLESMR